MSDQSQCSDLSHYLPCYIGVCCREWVLAAGFRVQACGLCGEIPTYDRPTDPLHITHPCNEALSADLRHLEGQEAQPPTEAPEGPQIEAQSVSEVFLDDMVTVCIAHGAFIPCRRSGKHVYTQNLFWVDRVRQYQQAPEWLWKEWIG